MRPANIMRTWSYPFRNGAMPQLVQEFHKECVHQQAYACELVPLDPDFGGRRAAARSQRVE